MTVPPPMSQDEAERQASLDRLNILNTPIESRYDRLTRQALIEFEAMSCYISLVDRDREWYKSIQGSDSCESSRAESFCGHAILADDVFVVEDATKDERFVNNPQVTQPPFVRFYAGAQVRDRDGHALGMFCIKDNKPRTISENDKQKLRDFAEAVAMYFELQERGGVEADFAASLDEDDAATYVDPVTRTWGRLGILKIANMIVNSEGTELLSMPFGCGIVHLKLATKDDRVMSAAGARLLNDLRDLDVVGRYDDDSFLLILSGCRTDEDTKELCSELLDRLAAPPQAPSDPVMPAAGLPVQAGAVFLPFKIGANLDEAVIEARRAMRNDPITRAAA